MKHLPTITRLAIPAAMVSFLTIEITKSQQVTGWLVYLVTFAAFFTSLGIELWGIIAGDNLDKSWKLDHGRSWAVVQMIVYVLVGAWLLRHNTTIIMLPLVAALAYVASGFADSLDTAVQSKEQETAVAREFGREQEAADRELERELKLAKVRLAHEEKLVKLQTPKNKAISTRSDTAHFPNDYRLLTIEQKDQIASMASGTLQEMADISASTARRWKQKVSANGFHK